MFVRRVDIGEEVWAQVEVGPCPWCGGNHVHAHRLDRGYVGNLVALPLQLEARAFVAELVS